DPPRAVAARVVDDGDEPPQREPLVQVIVQAPDRRIETGLLVVDGDDDLDLRGRTVGTVGVDAEEAQVGGRGRAHVDTVAVATDTDLHCSLEFPQNRGFGDLDVYARRRHRPHGRERT